jgi:hydrogenase/urease accessory protein HupE
MSAFFRISAVVILLSVGADSARAEAPIGGIEGFYGGLLRPILVPAHALGLLALGLFIGQQDSRDRRAPAAIFAAALIIGLGALVLAVGQTPAADVLLVNTAALGVLVAIARPLPRPVGWLAAAVTGAAVGLDSPPQVISIALATVTLIGTGLGACIALAIVVGVTACLRRHWQLLGVRILGSWIAASAVLALAVRWAR